MECLGEDTFFDIVEFAYRAFSNEGFLIMAVSTPHFTQNCAPVEIIAQAVYWKSLNTSGTDRYTQEELCQPRKSMVYLANSD